ncbi:cysteine methyltransferase [Helicobacter sp. 12S02232-10]|nr:cysteine methyltransferase [Helicobacter sp. 12S02232-10]
MYHYFIDAPLEFGVKYIDICSSDTGIKSVSFANQKNQEENPNDLALSCAEALKGYFEGRVFSFDLPLEPDGTPFQKKVWRILCDIKFGEVWSYKDLALKIGSTNYSRAVGSANSKNPIFIIIPCHRVIGNDGKLSGYAAGVEIKKWLLEHEKKFSSKI